MRPSGRLPSSSRLRRWTPLLAESWIFLIMLGTFLLTAFAFNLPIGICLMIASVCGALSGGQGFALRHLFEGSFGYLNTILVIATAMMFMKGIQKSGLLDTVARARSGP